MACGRPEADSAPIVYVHGQPGRTNASVRTLERTAATLTASDLATGKTVPLINYQADPVEMKLLHMITGDPKRTATDALFANPDFWLDSSLPSSCAKTVLACEPSGGAQSPAAAGSSAGLINAANGLLGQASALAGEQQAAGPPVRVTSARSRRGRSRRSSRWRAAWW